ncbi:cholinesterase-like isoform X2 [Gigantopelta aegis]|uniref:cholinesterase-like isoform X2 n=1 Tax=Gigantopelta aegis TaxID=1735272 RepID=UPI001B8889DE|nr:cholinesterase-like isoform X2 [Gigantopelta aegis]
MDLPARTLLHVCVLCVVITNSTCVRHHHSRGYSVDRKTKYGRVRGFVERVYNKEEVEKYLGIPYAQAPVGNLRFEAPRAPTSWGSRILHAGELPPACPQPRMGVNAIDYLVPGFNRTNEDCLYLNVHVPRHGHRKPYPVVVFVHGGSYQIGMGATLHGDLLATHEVIVVTFNYRLGPLGFLTSSDSHIPGNFGMLDQIEALKWVKENIANFDGDPRRVTIDGHSAGACSVGLLMVSPLARGLFQSVIQQSGSPFAHWALTRRPTGPSIYFEDFTSRLGCTGNNTAHIKRCLQRLPSDRLERMIGKDFDMPPSIVPAFRPVVDGYFLPDTPENLAVKGPINAKHFLTGATKDEGLLFAIPFVDQHGIGKQGSQKLIAVMSCFRGDLPEVRGIVESVLQQYTRWPVEKGEDQVKQNFAEIVGDYFIVAPIHKSANVLSRHNLTVFIYNYEYKSKFDEWRGVIHGAELSYLSGFPIISHRNFRYTEEDKNMARMLLMLWANFIKNGLPSLVPLKEFHMARFTEQRPLYTRLFSHDDDPAVAIATHFKAQKMNFWNKKVPEMYRKQFRDSYMYGFEENVTARGRYVITYSSNSWILIAACIGLSVLTVLLSVCYCQMRRQVSILIRQNSVSSGESML